jgi:hypothetical protein
LQLDRGYYEEENRGSLFYPNGLDGDNEIWALVEKV